MDTSRSTLGELAGLAIERELIRHCTFSKDSVGLAIEDLDLTLSPEDARQLLQLIVSGAAAQERTHAEPRSATRAVPPVPARDPEDSLTRRAVSQVVIRKVLSREQEQKAQAQEPPQAEAYQKRELFRAPSAPRAPEPSHHTERPGEEAAAGGDGDTYREDLISEEYLDSVLSFALTMQLIEGYTKDRESRTVILRTGATTTGLTYWETLEYLTNSMLYELRPKSER